MSRRRTVCLFIVFCWALIADPSQTTHPPVPLAVKPALAGITAANLRGDLSFLASDALEGRYAPSPELNIAAEFIASQFRAAGLEPAGDQGYFQTARMIDRQMKPAPSDMQLFNGSEASTVNKQSIQVVDAAAALRVDKCPVLVFRAKDPAALKGLDLRDKAVVAPNFSRASVPEKELESAYKKSRAFDEAVEQAHARMEILAGKPRGRERSQLLEAADTSQLKPPIVVAESDELKSWIDHPNSAPSGRAVSFDVPAPEDHPAVLKNVIGILRGSDPNLKDTYVLLTAHYDHIGTAATGAFMTAQKPRNTSDKIYNGANDDGSGTVSVIEIARGLSKLKVHPRRTLVFMTFFGEERGDIGSGYYGDHPVFPVAKTVADVNLEQVGRTDSTEGKQLSNASVTGFDYSTVTRYLQNAGKQTGVTVYLNKEASDAYFQRSDNAALAERGVPSHTLCVAFDYPDYHGLGDEWQKIDYNNMAKVDRMVALALWNIGNAKQPPLWNAANPKTAEFRAARKKSTAPGNHPPA